MHPRPGPPPARVAVVGTHGFGRSHLVAVASAAAAGTARLVAVADTVEPAPGSLPDGTPVFGSLEALLAAVPVDVVTIATPIHTHAPLATLALGAGADVLLEKPPTASLAEFDALTALAADRGRAVQVGFQSLGSDALPFLRGLLVDGRLGPLRGVGGYGAWVRDTRYWARSAWAGHRRTPDGRPVVDGVTTNPLAHAVATALALAGAARTDDVAAVDVELSRANAIEADDTSVVSLTTAAGVRVVVGLTLCAAADALPTVSLLGERGRATFAYTADEVLVEVGGAEPERLTFGRTPLLDNLLAHRLDPSVPLLVPLTATGAFTRVLEAVRTADDPARVPEHLVTWVDDDAGRHPVLHDVEHWLTRASTELRSLADLGAPWVAPTIHPESQRNG